MFFFEKKNQKTFVSCALYFAICFKVQSLIGAAAFFSLPLVGRAGVGAPGIGNISRLPGITHQSL
jgi:hypothetical protein